MRNDKEVLKMEGDKIISTYVSQVSAIDNNSFHQSSFQRAMNRYQTVFFGFTWISRNNLDEYLASRIISKVCNRKGCKEKGTPQSLKCFKPVTGNVDGYSGYCNTCLYASRVQDAVKKLDDDQYLINGVRYKLWANGFLFIHNGLEFIKSGNNVDWLKRTIRRFENAQA